MEGSRALVPILHGSSASAGATGARQMSHSRSLRLACTSQPQRASGMRLPPHGRSSLQCCDASEPFGTLELEGGCVGNDGCIGDDDDDDVDEDNDDDPRVLALPSASPGLVLNGKGCSLRAVRRMVCWREALSTCRREEEEMKD